MILYIIDDIVNLIYKKRVIKEKFKSVSKGYITNKEKFMEEFLNLVNKEKIKNKFLGNKIEIIDNSYFKFSDKYLIENIFIELGFIKIVFKNIKDYFNKNRTYIEINNTYMVINLDMGIYLDLEYFKVEEVIKYFENVVDNDLILFGVNGKIANLDFNSRRVYYLQNKENYIIDCLL